MEAKGLLSLVTFSERRRDILLMLQEEPKTLKEIKEHFRISSPEIIPQIRKLERGNLIYQEGKKYVLTEAGEIVTKSFEQLLRTLKLFEKDMEFWKEHKIEIPEEFRSRLYELGGYKIFVSTPTEIFKPHDEYIENLLKSKWIKGVSPVLHPEYTKNFLMMAKKGLPISLILTKEVLEKIKEKHKTELVSGLKCKNAQMMVCNEEITVAFTVTDFFLSMRLFLRDGTYDFYKNIISREKSALNWGADLFRYYETRSEKVDLQDF